MTQKTIAITREVSPTIANCELTHLERASIDARLAAAQHRQYASCLRDLGCELVSLPAEPDLPDSVFVEDTAIILDELAIITRPGAASRRRETISIADTLARYRNLSYIIAPGSIDGGDVLQIDQTLYIGLSKRSNTAGVEQMTALLEPLGYSVTGVPVNGCLHLKSAVTLVAPNTLLVNDHWVDTGVFSGMQVIQTDSAEPFAANALLINETIVYPADFPLTRKRLEDYGLKICTVDLSELAKAEGGVTCCSLIFNA
jgi:dimethylargininase